MIVRTFLVVSFWIAALSEICLACGLGLFLFQAPMLEVRAFRLADAVGTC